MEKITIELPSITEINIPEKPIGTAPRRALVEFTANGRILSKEESESIIQKWVDYIKKIVPQTDFHSTEMEVFYEESPKERARITNQALRSDPEGLKRIGIDPEKAIKSSDETVAKIIDDVGLYTIHFIQGNWIVAGEGDDIILLSISLRLKNNKEDAWVMGFAEGPFPEVSQYFSSWKEGVKKYLEIGTERLKKYAPLMEIPLPE